MSMLPYPLAAAMFVGHVAVWTWLYNRLHASGLPSRLVQRLEKWVVLVMAASAIPLTYRVVTQGDRWLQTDTQWTTWLVVTWSAGCWLMFLYACVAWALRQRPSRYATQLLSNDTDCLDVTARLGHRPTGDTLTQWLSRIPGNQILEVHAHHKVLHDPRLPVDLDGLRIAQLTDLHMTGQLTRAFFELAVDRINQWQPDLVAVTGDLVDKMQCLDWLPETLGRLQSRHGALAILGNHDQRLSDSRRLRAAVTDCGLDEIGGRAVVHRVRRTEVLIAGNEFPWFPRPADADLAGLGQVSYAILLSHSPDQLPWARAHGFHLMLAGHTHGGQICFPIVGPVVCPSRFGVRYASGMFDEPPTLMHVSRGLSGVHPLRFNCPPEVTLLELRRAIPDPV